MSLHATFESPAFIDLHAHLREPGFEESETVATGARAALAGGFAVACAMPDTDPPIDSPGLVADVIARAAAAGAARILPIASITRGRRGRELADLVELAAAGAVAFSDGFSVEDAGLLRHALEYASGRGLLVMECPRDNALASRGVMHEGAVSARLGLPGIPAAAEEIAVARDIALARLSGARVHLASLSTARSIELVRRAKAEGLAITCDVTPHHLAMTDEWVAGSRGFAWEDPRAASRVAPFDSSTKMDPPLRTIADVRALWEGIADGTVDAIATDHSPHTSVRKDVEFDQAAFGMTGFETALPLVLGGVRAGWASLDAVLRALTRGPARVLGIGLAADPRVTVDAQAEWSPTADGLLSKGKNTPLIGATLRGRIVSRSTVRSERTREKATVGRR